MAFDIKMVGNWALWLGAIAHVVLGIALLSDLGGALLESLL